MGVYKMQEGLETRKILSKDLKGTDSLEDLKVNIRLIQTGSSTTQGGLCWLVSSGLGYRAVTGILHCSNRAYSKS